MLSKTTLRTATTLLALGLAVAGCKSSKGSATASPMTSLRPSTVSSPAATAAGPAASPPGSGRVGAKTCPAGHTSAVIGGANKCLAPGQECSAKHLNDYTQYGFTCEQNGNRYTLKKNA